MGWETYFIVVDSSIIIFLPLYKEDPSPLFTSLWGCVVSEDLKAKSLHPTYSKGLPHGEQRMASKLDVRMHAPL